MHSIVVAERIVAQIRPLLAGQGPDVQGAVLVDLLASYIAGHHPALRAEVLDFTVQAVMDMIPYNVPANAPPEWKGPH